MQKFLKTDFYVPQNQFYNETPVYHESDRWMSRISKNNAPIRMSLVRVLESD